MASTLSEIRLKEPPFYNREYQNDQTEPTSKFWGCVNLTLLILPNLSHAFSRPIVIGSGTLRTWAFWTKDNLETIQICHAVFATVALAATFFKHPVGMILTTAQDLSLELTQLYTVLNTTKNSQKIKEHCLNIINNILYLLIFIKGGIELVILSLILQIVTALYRSYHAYLAGNRFNLTLQLFTAAFRCNQLRGQIHLRSLTHELVKKGSTFNIIKPLGRGSKGEVFLAQRADKTFIAVKKYHPQETYNDGSFLGHLYSDVNYYSNGVARFAGRELDLGKHFDHPHILKLYDQAVRFDEAGNPETYLLMEYVEKKPESLTPEESIQTCLQFMDALKAGLRAGYVQTDQHSENMLVDVQGNLKLIDIDSFEEISDNEDIKNKSHLKEIVSTMKDLLQTHEKSAEIEESLKKVIKSDELEGQKYLSEASPSTYFFPMFEKMEAILKAYLK